MHKTITPRLIPALLAIAFSGGAAASGFQLIEQNASGIGNAYAGSAAVAENASTIFYNPAGMTQLKDREVSLGIAAVRPIFTFHDSGRSVGLPGGEGGDAGHLALLPNAYLSWRLSEQWYAGLGFGAPFGLMTEYDDPWTGGAQSNKFDIKTYNINPSLAWKVNEQVSLGMGLNWQRIEAEYRRTAAVGLGVPGAALGPLAPLAPAINGALPNTTMKLKADDNAWSWNVGALFSITPDTRIGVSYRSRIRYQMSGKVTTSGALLGVPVVGAMVPASVPAKLNVDLPDAFILSGAHQLNERWQLLADVSWTGWSCIPRIDIKSNGATLQTLNTDFKDTWRVALGANYQVNDAWKWKVGVAYDQTPIKRAETRLASLPDNDRVWLSTGVQWKVTKDSALDLGVAYLYLKDARIRNDQRYDPATGKPSLAGLPVSYGSLDGYYKDSVWIVGVQYSASF